MRNEKDILKIWLATPDQASAKPVNLPFKQTGDKVTFTVPSLQYWDMIVIEYK
ncbi:glycoside hydrolase family 66 protein [Bacillus xiapuensis]|uniref:glycoside hydrolase family 66 protein n=1 Tax=Bacillus xiapuensis TaxID=2014075 RepID=UPI000C24D967